MCATHFKHENSFGRDIDSGSGVAGGGRAVPETGPEGGSTLEANIALMCIVKNKQQQIVFLWAETVLGPHFNVDKNNDEPQQQQQQEIEPKTRNWTKKPEPESEIEVEENKR